MKNKPFLLFLALFISFLVFIFATYQNYGISWDESAFWYKGKLLAQNFFDTEAIFKKVPEPHLQNHGDIFEPIYYILQKSDKDPNFERLHLIKALFASQTLLALYLILKTLSKNKYIPVIGVLLLIFFPRWTGDIFDNHVDIITTWLYAWLLYLGLKILLERRINRLLGFLLLFSFTQALSFSHRSFLMVASVILFPLFIIKKGKKLLHSVKILITSGIAILTFFITIFATTPYVRYYGLLGIYRRLFAGVTAQFGLPGDTLFDGKIYSTNNLPWYYLSKWITITTPLITLIFFTLGTIYMLSQILGKRKNSLTFPYIFILLSFFFPLFAIFIIHPIIYDGWRIFLFFSLPLVVIGALGCDMLLQYPKRYIRLLTIFLLIINISLTGREMYRLHPYEYIYFNSLVGGLPRASQNYETDYWGKSFKEAALWLKEFEISKRSPNRIYSVFLCDTPDMAFPYFNYQMIAVNSPDHADYFICYTRNRDSDMQEIEKKAKTVYLVKREGVTLNYVERLR